METTKPHHGQRLLVLLCDVNSTVSGKTTWRICHKQEGAPNMPCSTLQHAYIYPKFLQKQIFRMIFQFWDRAMDMGLSINHDGMI